MQRDYITLRKHLDQWLEFYTLPFEVFIGNQVESKHPASKPLHDGREYLPDLASTNNAYSFPDKVKTRKPGKRKIPFPYPVICLMNFPVECKDQSHSKLG